MRPNYRRGAENKFLGNSQFGHRSPTKNRAQTELIGKFMPCIRKSGFAVERSPSENVLNPSKILQKEGTALGSQVYLWRPNVPKGCIKPGSLKRFF